MSWIVAILSVFLVIACLLLILLVLIQLPKKEAGMGQAFGGGATDALFGAGSGTALTKMTKYTTGIFFVLTLLLSVLKAQQVKHSGSTLERNMQQFGKEKPALPVVPSTPSAPVTASKGTSAPSAMLTTPASSNTSLLLGSPNTNLSTVTNAPKAATTPPPAAEAEKPK